jgi:hypothetical protein
MPTAKQFKIGDVVKLTGLCPKKLEAFKDGDFFVMECLDGDHSITVRPFGEQKILGPFFSWRFDLVKSPTVAQEDIATSQYKPGKKVKVKPNYPNQIKMIGMNGELVKKDTENTWQIKWYQSLDYKNYWPVHYWQESWLELLPDDFPVPVPNYGGDVPVDDETFVEGLDAADTLEAMDPSPAPSHTGPIAWKYNPDTKEKTLIDPATLPKPDQWQVGDFALITEGAYKGWIAPVVDLHPDNKKVVRITIKGTKGFNETVWYVKEHLKKVPKPTGVYLKLFTPAYIIIRVCPNGKAVGSTLPKIHNNRKEASDETKKLALENPGHSFYVMKALDMMTAQVENVDVPVPAEV